jgi:hypothetical protein
VNKNIMEMINKMTMLVVLYLGMSGDDTAAENWDHIGAKFV